MTPRSEAAMVVQRTQPEALMTLYMDVHDSLPEGTTVADVAGAHARDLQVQGGYGVDYRNYWVDEANGKAWYLVEAPDGAGYPRGLSAASLPLPDRVLAAAVAYESALEPRPYRTAMTPGGAADRLLARAQSGALDLTAVNGVLTVAGHTTAKPAARDDGLTPREVEILLHVAQGQSNQQIAQRFTLSEKTVRNHVERIYGKLGVATASGQVFTPWRTGSFQRNALAMSPEGEPVHLANPRSTDGRAGVR
jgi:DNA-binding CsgD family transcriptional regulator